MLTLPMSSSRPSVRPPRAVVAHASERKRLRAHFRAVTAELRARDVSRLSDAQRSARARLVAELERYAAAGRFPHNHVVPGRRVPVFVDRHATRCAMAHLIESTGHAALVARVAASHNLARIHELAGDAELRRWLDDYGLSVAEAGRIQPEYCFVTKAQDCLCNGIEDASGVIEATFVRAGPGDESTVRVDAVHGETGLAVGDEVSLYIAAPGEGKLLIAVRGEEFGLDRPLGLRDDGTVELTCGDDVPDLAREDAIAALLASDCEAHLDAVDSNWSRSICRGKGCDCALDGEPDAFGAALLAVLVGWHAVRRRRGVKASRD
ncbi:MYXO-CTERM sorting domain-containing protein [Nannocystis bainbridge]|uniref:MYXO-CTERM sorting domain-containing protein n=1 Tax=Nannocystis bainbridge TaxID=2995303 RepID=A0ABT5DQ25_9BACT|nr:MYXO-CTERM sorting domain-containing protein [Nannocystis bainbridge]MDC0715769.1 MYXO-CTERM sorting domain-containing protein [Nannocystis bainbridge]